MTKRIPQVTLTRNEQGQISIFFSASLVVMVSVIAFVINIGLFVKAKINLQNATDAAAYSGAAVQARQLSKIAYLNWDMRNIYKEWMYKYYVVGNLNIEDVENPPASGVMSFKLKTDLEVLSGVQTPDPFNIPAVCIHLAGSKTNICKRYSVPGLPEFGSSNLAGAEDASRAFLDTLIATKVNDCVDRSRLNMTVANTWTYNVLANTMDESLVGQGPAILSDKQGAWPRAVELAMRIRNLEHVMNRPAETSGICAEGSTSGGLTRCSKSITEIIGERKLGNERIVKAFYSGYRNLGNEADSEMKASFTLSEIPPKEVIHSSMADASNLLTPSAQTKQWVDLKLMMVNYAIFYAAMIPRADSKTSGACDISKVAIPVPGYPMGFYKDPNLLTYYAVKGEAEFVGMFNPFNEKVINLQAYSAAKPFGGRIGPALFIQKPNQDFLVSRDDGGKRRSIPYITSYDFTGVTIRGVTHTANNFIPGIPIPTNSNVAPGTFWLEDSSQPIGGRIADAAGIRFGVPNLVYDYEVPYQTSGYVTGDDNILIIKARDPSSEEAVGLLSSFQFGKFRGNNLDATISAETLDAEISRVKAPTSYDAANYLIPTPNEFNVASELDSFGFINGPKTELSNGYDRYRADIYAPLYKSSDNEQTDLLWKSQGEVVSTIKDFMRAQSSGMSKYKMAMNRVAMNIYKQKDNVAPGATESADGYIRAAEGVSKIDFTDPTNFDQSPKDCESLAGQFLFFYYGGGVGLEDPVNEITDACPKPLGDLIEEYFSQSSIDGFSASHYAYNLSWKRGTPKDEGIRLMSAYTPGPFTGIGMDGEFQNPIDSSLSDTMRRNHYATKFIALDSLRVGGDAQWDNQTFAIYSEGDVNTQGETSQGSFANPLEPDRIDSDLSDIKY